LTNYWLQLFWYFHLCSLHLVITLCSIICSRYSNAYSKNEKKRAQFRRKKPGSMNKNWRSGTKKGHEISRTLHSRLKRFKFFLNLVQLSHWFQSLHLLLLQWDLKSRNDNILIFLSCLNLKNCVFTSLSWIVSSISTVTLLNCLNTSVICLSGRNGSFKPTTIYGLCAMEFSQNRFKNRNFIHHCFSKICKLRLTLSLGRLVT
jgi:hypothetical protein